MIRMTEEIVKQLMCTEFKSGTILDPYFNSIYKLLGRFINVSTPDGLEHIEGADKMFYDVLSYRIATEKSISDTVDLHKLLVAYKEDKLMEHLQNNPFYDSEDLDKPELVLLHKEAEQYINYTAYKSTNKLNKLLALHYRYYDLVMHEEEYLGLSQILKAVTGEVFLELRQEELLTTAIREDLHATTEHDFISGILTISVLPVIYDWSLQHDEDLSIMLRLLNYSLYQESDIKESKFCIRFMNELVSFLENK